MRKLSKEEILSSFSKKQRRKVKIPDLKNIQWEDIDFLGWIHPSGHLGYIVYNFKSSLVGLVLSRTKPSNPSKRAIMCHLCKTVHSTSFGVLLFTVQSYCNPKNESGNYICADLQCSLYVRGIKFASANQMPETISKDDKIIRLIEGVEEFILQVSK